MGNRIASGFRDRLARREAAWSEYFNPDRIFSQILGGSPEQLSNRLGNHLAEFRSLAEERNPEMFFHGLLNLGMRLEGENNLEGASAVYSALATPHPPLPGHSLPQGERGIVQMVVPLEVQRRAAERLGAMQGFGSAGPRAEFLLRRLSREALEPTTLLGLGVASAAFRVTRLVALSRLLAAPSSNFLTRGFGAQLTAGVAGFAVEATVFPLATRLGHVALGRNLDWSPGQVGREIASSFIVLGALKLGAVAANSVGAGLVSAPQHGVPQIWWRPRIPALGRTLGPPLQQAGMLGGILLGHRVEEAVGLRPHLDGATTTVDSLALLLQFNVAGNVARQALGNRLHRWEREIEERTRAAGRSADWLQSPRRFELSEALAGARTGPRVESPDRPYEFPHIFLSKSTKGENPGSDSITIPQPVSTPDALDPLLRPRVPRVLVSTSSGETRNFVYELVLDPAHSPRQLRDSTVIAYRNGREIRIRPIEFLEAEPLGDYYPVGVSGIKFQIQEGGKRGLAVVYFPPGEVSLFNIRTPQMDPGVGTIVMDWLASDTALRGLNFHLMRVDNPHVFKILSRSQLFNPVATMLEACYWEEVHGHSVEAVGRIGDPAFMEQHGLAHFLSVRGLPNPDLLPPELRSFRVPREIRTSETRRAHSYQLAIQPLAFHLLKDSYRVIAQRDGGEISLELKASGRTAVADGFYPVGTPWVDFLIHEGPHRGHAKIYLEPGQLTLEAIQTQSFQKGAGTIVMDWLATQAALHGMNFGVNTIVNSQILRILSRSQLLKPGAAVLEACTYCSTGFDVQERGPFEDFGVLARNPFRDFSKVRGAPNPTLLPAEFRRDP